MTYRPKYLKQMDEAQDIVSQHPGLTMDEIAKHMGVGYAQVQQAMSRLRDRGRVIAQEVPNNRPGRKKMIFFPKP